jgi:hypothetical protein
MDSARGGGTLLRLTVKLTNQPDGTAAGMLISIDQNWGRNTDRRGRADELAPDVARLFRRWTLRGRFGGRINLDGPADRAAIRTLETKICGVPAVTQFLGGAPDEQPERYRDASPLSFLPLGIPQEFIGGGLVKGAMEQILAYQASAQAKGDVVTITTLDGAGHFDMLAPRSEYWKRVEARFHELLR